MCDPAQPVNAAANTAIATICMYFIFINQFLVLLPETTSDFISIILYNSTISQVSINVDEGDGLTVM